MWALIQWKPRLQFLRVKGHAGRLRRVTYVLLNSWRNDRADMAADMGRLRQSELFFDARRVLLKTRRQWYTIMLDFHKYMGSSFSHCGKP